MDLAGNTMSPVSWSFTTADTTAPTAVAGSELPTPGSTTFDFTITYTDSGSGLDASTFDNNDITVTGPNGFNQNALFVSVDNTANGSPRTVTYRINAPGGLWNVLDNGSYSINLNDSQVKNIAGNFIPSGTLRTFDPALPFAYQSGSTVYIDFDGSAAPITVEPGSGDITASDGTSTFSFTGVTSAIATGTSGDDILNFNGPITPAITFNGGAGNDTLNVNSGTYVLAADASSTTDNLAINVNGGNVVFQSTQHLASLAIADNALATMVANGNLYLQTAMLSIDPLGTLDLNDNDFIAGGVPFSTVQNWIFDGYSSTPDSTRHGIISTVSQNSGGNAMLMVFDNALAGIGEWPVGSGNSAPANAICGKYTYFGDTNLDGTVTGDDYAAIDANLGTTGLDPGIAILYGDTNFDGNITGDDYASVDANLGLGVGSPLATAQLIVQPPPTPAALIIGRNADLLDG